MVTSEYQCPGEIFQEVGQIQPFPGFEGHDPQAEAFLWLSWLCNNTAFTSCKNFYCTACIFSAGRVRLWFTD